MTGADQGNLGTCVIITCKQLKTKSAQKSEPLRLGEPGRNEHAKRGQFPCFISDLTLNFLEAKEKG